MGIPHMTDILSWIRLEGPFLIGHRGNAAHDRENTPRAFETALEAGCDGVELDVRLTRDLVPVVHHDDLVTDERGMAPLAELTWDEIRDARFDSDGGPYRVHRGRRLPGFGSGSRRRYTSWPGAASP